MSRVTSLTNMPEAQLNRWLKRLGLIFLVLLVAFVAFYAVDRYRAKPAPIVDAQIATLEAAVQKDPADTTSRGKLADLYYAKHQFQSAIEQYTALITAKSNVEMATLGRANSYLQLKQYDQAKPDFEAVVAIAAPGEMANVDPNLESSYYNLGVIALAQNKPSDAVDLLNKALAITRTDADALNAIGQAYVATGDSQKAIDSLRKAVALVPVGWPEPYQTMAAAYTKLNQPDFAAWANAMAQVESGDMNGAEAALTKLTDGAAKVEAMVGLGILYEQKGDAATAASWYQKVLAVDPTNEVATFGIKRVGGTVPNAGASAAPSASAGTN